MFWVQLTQVTSKTAVRVDLEIAVQRLVRLILLSRLKL